MRVRLALSYGSAFLALSVLGRLSLQPSTGLAFFWPAAGVSVAWLLRCRTVRESLQACGVVFVAATAVSLATRAGLPASLLLGAGNVAVAGLPRRLVLLLRDLSFGWRRWRGTHGPRQLGPALPVVQSPADFLLLLVGVGVGAVFSSPAGMLALLVRDAGPRWIDFVAWIVRNGIGALVVGGTILAVSGARRSAGGHRRAPGVEIALIMLATVGSVWLVFRPGQSLVLSFVPLGVVAWAGMRLRPAWAAVQGLLLGAWVAVVVRFFGRGPLGGTLAPQTEALVIQLYIGLTFGLALGIALVVAERDAIAARLRRSEQLAQARAAQLRAITETIQEALVVIDRAGRVVLQNPVAADLVGPDSGAAALEGVGLTDVGGRPLDPAHAPGRRALAGETVRDLTVVVRDDGVPVRVLAVDAAPLWRPEETAPGGTTAAPRPHRLWDGLRPGADEEQTPPQQAVLVFRDVTAAHEKVELLETFAATVAHDLQNPIASVQGWTENALEELDDRLTPDRDGRVRRSLTRIGNGADRAQNLVNDLLGYSTARTAQMRTEPVDLDRLVDQIRREVTEDAGDRRVQVTRGPLGTLLADRGMVRQLLTNLIGNAVKYTDSTRSPEVDVRLTQDGTEVLLTVTDNGIGVPPAHRELVFDAFHRAPTQGRYPGTGLGLAICASVARRHGGRISVSDRPDGRSGSVFTVRLPADLVQPEDRVTEGGAAAPAGTAVRPEPAPARSTSAAPRSGWVADPAVATDG
ncbi:signal transduction histidine kinase [Friedmanniella endophytica]|uniref:Sensor-like histidine kinase SenX3 n=1 Tax=Microlunatus kandeliicorticis TaxID=1759536 RepID=A0A7W3IS59_9ACTN|nr:ATP-binding protein [Microlunatus kandeliicorticis]MBA8794256.1 signal transduction histidine kinase [Microlunatus kandeliicorticis]